VTRWHSPDGKLSVKEVMDQFVDMALLGMTTRSPMEMPQFAAAPAVKATAKLAAKPAAKPVAQPVAKGATKGVSKPTAKTAAPSAARKKAATAA